MFGKTTNNKAASSLIALLMLAPLILNFSQSAVGQFGFVASQNGNATVQNGQVA